MSEVDDKTKASLSETTDATADATVDASVNATVEAAPSAVPAASAQNDLVGQLVGGRYKVIKLLGRGGMGSVYYVDQVFLKKHFALKTFTSSDSDLARLRFQKEAQAASKLDHANIARVMDFGSIDDLRLFMVMEYVDGPDLSQYLKKQGQLSVADALEIFIPIVRALDHAHKQGVIHRDIKPSNIVLVAATEGLGQYIPKLLDFGIAKLLEERETEALTRTGEVFGTPLYMSPEQCAGEPVDARSDIYSLGCVLYEALTGAPPFHGRTALETMMMHRNAEAIPLSQASLGREIPDYIQHGVSRMIAKDPAQRYPSCLALAEDLVSLQQGASLSEGANATTKSQAPKSATRASLPWLMAAFTFVILIGFAVLSIKLYSLNHSEKKEVERGRHQSFVPEISLMGLPIPEPFSSAVQGEPTNRLYEFGEDLLGQIQLWEPGKSYWHFATERFPAKDSLKLLAKPITVLASESFIIKHPSAVLRFRPEEVYGLVLNHSKGKNIASVDPEKNPYYDGFLAYARKLSDLRFLDVGQTPVSNVGLDNIGLDQLHHLEILCVGPSSVDGSILAKSKILNQLTELELNEVKNAVAVLPAIEHSEKLHTLVLGKTGLTDVDLTELSHFTSLQYLDISGNPKITAAGVANLAKLPHLEGLYISSNTGLTPSSLMKMTWLRRLKKQGLRLTVGSEDRKKLDEFLGFNTFK